SALGLRDRCTNRTEHTRQLHETGVSSSQLLIERPFCGRSWAFRKVPGARGERKALENHGLFHPISRTPAGGAGGFPVLTLSSSWSGFRSDGLGRSPMRRNGGVSPGVGGRHLSCGIVRLGGTVRPGRRGLFLPSRGTFATIL